ncbi:MAG TPA: hypothetical protein VIH64_09740, partial [Streptosporangiaceae bacterium]
MGRSAPRSGFTPRALDITARARYGMDQLHDGDLPSHQTLPDILPHDPFRNPYHPVTFHQLRSRSA